MIFFRDLENLVLVPWNFFRSLVIFFRSLGIFLGAWEYLLGDWDIFRSPVICLGFFRGLRIFLGNCGFFLELGKPDFRMYEVYIVDIVN